MPCAFNEAIEKLNGFLSSIARRPIILAKHEQRTDYCLTLTQLSKQWVLSSTMLAYETTCRYSLIIGLTGHRAVYGGEVFKFQRSARYQIL
jgi:hypothetical protein